jgi:hypothetical protein
MSSIGYFNLSLINGFSRTGCGEENYLVGCHRSEMILSFAATIGPEKDA